MGLISATRSTYYPMDLRKSIIHGEKDGYYPMDLIGDPPIKSTGADLYEQLYNATERI